MKRGKPTVFAFCRKGIEEKEKGLDHLDRHAARCTGEPSQAIGNEGKKPPPSVLSLKVPGRGEQRQTPDQALAAQRQRKGEQTAHAVSDNADGSAGDGGRRRACRFQSFDDVAAQIEMTLRAARRAPIDYERPQSRTGEMTQKAALGKEIEDIVAVDQRGDDQ